MVKHFLGILVAILFLPTIVFADESYITYSDIKCNGQSASEQSGGTDISQYIEYSMNGQEGSKYSFVITGFNLNADEEYTYTLTSDFKNFKKTYTGAELMAGVTISGEDGNSMMESKLVDAYNKTLRNKHSKYTSDDWDIYFDITRLNFNKNFDFTEMDVIYNSMLKDGKVKVASVDPLDDSMFAETAITAALSKYDTDRYRIVGGCYEKNKCMINISDKVKTYREKTYETTFEYATPNSKIKNRLDGYAKTFVVDNQNIEEHLFLMEDLETINYKYAFPSFGEWIDSINAIINYSSEFQNKIGYMNIGTKLDTRAGWDDQFTSGCFGFLNLLFDGVIYSYVNTTGVKQNNVLYVPDETENTREAYIKAALDRVNKYIPKANVKIEGDYLVFETDHFSTYVIGGNKLENPATLDNVSTWIITTGVSLLVFAGAVLYKRKFNN